MTSAHPRGPIASTSNRARSGTRSTCARAPASFPEGHKVNALLTITAGVICKDANVVTRHRISDEAQRWSSYGYRFDTPDRGIVISGDNEPTQATIDACNRCDILHSRGADAGVAHPATGLSRIRLALSHDDDATRRPREQGEAASAHSLSCRRSPGAPRWDSQRSRPEELLREMAANCFGSRSSSAATWMCTFEAAATLEWRAKKLNWIGGPP